MKPNSKQGQLLDELLYYGLGELRALIETGKTDQAQALAQMLHNVPLIKHREEFSWDWLADDLARYGRRWGGLDGRYLDLIRKARKLV